MSSFRPNIAREIKLLQPFFLLVYIFRGDLFFFFGSLTSDPFNNLNITCFHSSNKDSSNIFLSDLATVILPCQVKLASCLKLHEILDWFWVKMSCWEALMALVTMDVNTHSATLQDMKWEVTREPIICNNV